MYLKNHIKQVHEGIKPHKCSKCNLSFGRKWSLTQHISKVHERKKVDIKKELEDGKNMKESADDQVKSTLERMIKFGDKVFVETSTNGNQGQNIELLE